MAESRANLVKKYKLQNESICGEFISGTMNQWESQLQIKILNEALGSGGSSLGRLIAFILFHPFKDLSVFAVTFIHLGLCKMKKMLITEKLYTYILYINIIR